MPLQSLQYTSSTPSLHILNQLLLPHRTEYVRIRGARAAFGAIRGMLVRGAPAIALVAALAVAVEDPFHLIEAATDDATVAALESSAPPLPSPEMLTSDGTAADAAEWYAARLAYLVQSRPTAVNLSDAVGKLTELVRRVAKDDASSAHAVREAYIAAAQRMLEADVEDNRWIGQYGADWLVQKAQLSEGRKGTLVTICNTGSLATAGYGTALGVIRSLHAAGVLQHVYYSETRPYNQGSRLTGYELAHDQIAATLITDSMAAALFQLKANSENIVAVVVGADRVAANGDTANKIGTYSLAVLARHHGVRFLVAAPRTTIDLRTASGTDIVIEERPQHEMLSVQGPVVLGYKEGKQAVDVNQTPTVSTAAPGTIAWNPAFDVTPAELIDGIVTEVGVAEKHRGKFALAELFQAAGVRENGI